MVHFLPVLKTGGVADLFSAFVTVDEAGKNKSFPDVFLLCAKKLGVRPQECLVFEDNLTAIRSAKAAGMQTAAVSDGQTLAHHPALRAEADAFIEDFYAFLKQINSEEKIMYTSKLSLIETERAIREIKTVFEDALSQALNLTRISAPLFVTRSSGLNDNLNGVERPVAFDIKESGKIAEVVHSLAKWKRFALKM